MQTHLPEKVRGANLSDIKSGGDTSLHNLRPPPVDIIRFVKIYWGSHVLMDRELDL